MRLPTTEHTSRPWRIHDLAPEFRLEDVWELPEVPNADDFRRLVHVISSLDPARRSSGLVRALFAIRVKLGELAGWDRPAANGEPGPPTLHGRLPADLLDRPRDPRSGTTPFVPLYQTEDEFAAELANRLVHGVVHIGRVPDESKGYRAQMAILVKPNGWVGSAYMAAIKPFRHLIVYPTVLREIERTWRRTSGPGSPVG